MSLPYRPSLSGNVRVDLSSVVFCRPARSTRITTTQGSLQRNKVAFCAIRIQGDMDLSLVSFRFKQYNTGKSS